MKYEERLIKYVKNTDGYLFNEWHEEIASFSDLSNRAVEFYAEKSISGKITALFIYHQLSLEILKLLIIYCNFHEQISLFPSKKNFKKLNSGSSFSEVIAVLKNKIQFNGKSEIIKKVTYLNKIRNQFGHNILTEWWNPEFENLLDNLPDWYNSFFDTYGTSLRDIITKINETKKRPEIQNLLNKKSSFRHI